MAVKAEVERAEVERAVKKNWAGPHIVELGPATIEDLKGKVKALARRVPCASLALTARSLNGARRSRPTTRRAC
eukprot:scaffold27070_cov63-Phaeocystis_antarctica.AAC.9